MERVLRSLQVLCSNSRNGCRAKMPYHEMEEHEKECPKAVCDRTGSNAMQPPAPLHHGFSTDCFTFVIPKQVSSSTSINISINNGEIKQNIHDNKISADPVVKMGPCGGGGGDAWKMDMRGVTRIFRVVVRHGEAVDAISALYERDGQAEESKLWGGTGGQRFEICLRQDEYLTSVKGHYGFFDKWFIIRSLTFVSNQRTFGPYGKQEGAPFKLPAAGGKIIGFHGRCSCGLLDSLGTYVKMG
uniref:Uncharacterized protein n=1 Tax=Avena sativa TaxID=4498 RepID=A0ACD5TSV5_AVESA